MKKMALRRLRTGVALVCLFVSAGFAEAQSAFTYQGVIKQGGSPMTGSVRLRFQLWNAVSGGAQIGSDLEQIGVPLSEGMFTVQLDFGAIAFDGNARWLAVSVVSIDGATVTTLSPRMAVTVVPQAMIATKALSVADGGLPATYASPISLTNPANALAGNFAGQTQFQSNVGIGASATPNATLGTLLVKSPSISGATTLRVQGYGGSGTEGRIRFQDDSKNVAIHNNANGVLTFTADEFVFTALNTAITNSMWIGNQLSVSSHFYAFGNVGIGTASPTSKLMVDVSTGNAMHVETNDAANGARAILGWAQASSGDTRAMYARADSTTGTGLFGWVPAASGTSVGVWGKADSTGTCVGVEGQVGAFGGFGYAVHGTQGNSGNGWAVYALGKFGASGTKAFRIDHPSDPENKYLLHYCSEGPEPLNVYSGSVRLNAMGEAVVELPAYFSEINIEPRIQLTAAGASMPNLYAAEEVVNNTFQVFGGKPNGKVYWEVKAVRNDRWVQQYGAPTEIEKPADERGLYQHPELYGKPAEMGANYVRQQRAAASNVVISDAAGDVARRPTQRNE